MPMRHATGYWSNQEYKFTEPLCSRCPIQISILTTALLLNIEYRLPTLATDRKFGAQFSCYSSHYRLCDVIGNGGLHACLFSVNIWLNMATKQYTVIYTDALFVWADYFVIKLCVWRIAQLNKGGISKYQEYIMNTGERSILIRLSTNAVKPKLCVFQGI